MPSKNEGHIEGPNVCISCIAGISAGAAICHIPSHQHLWGVTRLLSPRSRPLGPGASSAAVPRVDTAGPQDPLAAKARTHTRISLITGCLLKPGLPSLAESEQPLRAPPGSLPAGRGGGAPRCSFSSPQGRRWLSQRFWEGLFLLSTSSEQGSVIPRQRG